MLYEQLLSIDNTTPDLSLDKGLLPNRVQTEVTISNARAFILFFSVYDIDLVAFGRIKLNL